MTCVRSRIGIISKLNFKKVFNIYSTSHEDYVLLKLKSNEEKWTHLLQKKFHKTCEFDKER